MTVYVYGTLKNGDYNFNRLDFRNRTKFLGEATLNGAVMYDLGNYPCIVLTGNEEEVVYGEIYEYLDSKLEERVRRMEINAGYVEKQLFINGINALTYIYDKVPGNSIKIKNGNWVKKF